MENDRNEKKNRVSHDYRGSLGSTSLNILTRATNWRLTVIHDILDSFLDYTISGVNVVTKRSFCLRFYWCILMNATMSISSWIFCESFSKDLCKSVLEMSPIDY
jgi:hypothetical protein